MYLLTQKRNDIISVNDKTNITIVAKDTDYALYMRNGMVGDRGPVSFAIGFFKDKENARFVLTQIFDAISNGESYEVPREADLPELRIIRGRGTTTSSKVNHGKS